ncbi:glycosyltransferase [Arenibacter aquaticus]|uniref:Glycosyltransferase n=1 Tax=Arenibacter aquaticus TaxID=2489054 RepID=A0A3S0CL35_9FLAO|nr:glycosyltransferase [Arenibacter aquaticus]RTE53804.1 glycosyltransferase [Arenibacter aquaticus]
MKVLQLINSLAAGGAEKLLVDSVIGYHNRGIKVDILLLRGGSSPFTDKLKKYPNIKIYDLGIKTNVYNPKLIFFLHKHFKNYDIIHVHLFPALYWASFTRFFNKSKYKMLLTEHSTNNKRRNNPLFQFVDKIIYKQYDYIVPISDSASKNLKNHLGLSYNNIKTINNGIDLKIIRNAKAYSKSSLNLNEEDFVLIQVSSFRYPKDQKTVIKALNFLPKNVHLLLVGEGPLKQEAQDFTHLLNLSNRVHFLNLRTDVPELLKTADIAILSSHYEGLSLSSVEGLASGKPFLSTEAPGLTDVVEGAGLLFPIGDEQKLAEIITKLKNEESFYSEISKKGVERSKNYDIELMIDQYLELYYIMVKN